MSKKGGSPDCEWMKYYDGLLFEIRQYFGKIER